MPGIFQFPASAERNLATLSSLRSVAIPLQYKPFETAPYLF